MVRRDERKSIHKTTTSPSTINPPPLQLSRNMKVLQVSFLVLLGSVSASSRVLQDENGTAIATDGDIGVFMNTTFDSDPTSPIDLTATTAAPTDPAATSTAAAAVVTESFANTATTEAAPVTQSGESTAATEPIDSESVGAPTANGVGTTLTFGNGDQSTLDASQLSKNTNIRVDNSSTLFITNNGMTLNGYCDSCAFPNATIDISDSSNLIIRGDDISIFGTNAASSLSDAGGSAIELSMRSKAMIDGSIVIQGGDGDGSAGVGGDALALFNEAYVEISGDAILQGGVGAEDGKALMIDTSSTAKINSGTFKSSVWIENGMIDVYGGLFEEAVTLNGGQASATFYGCFVASVQDDSDISRSVELSGTFFNSTSSATQTINVALTDGAELKTDGGNDCAGETISTDPGNSTSTLVDDYVEYTDDAATTYPPSYMPTLGPENDGAKATSSMFAFGLVLSQYVFGVF